MTISSEEDSTAPPPVVGSTTTTTATTAMAMANGVAVIPADGGVVVVAEPCGPLSDDPLAPPPDEGSGTREQEAVGVVFPGRYSFSRKDAHIGGSRDEEGSKIIEPQILKLSAAISSAAQSFGTRAQSYGLSVAKAVDPPLCFIVRRFEEGGMGSGALAGFSEVYDMSYSTVLMLAVKLREVAASFGGADIIWSGGLGKTTASFLQGSCSDAYVLGIDLTAVCVRVFEYPARVWAQISSGQPAGEWAQDVLDRTCRRYISRASFEKYFEIAQTYWREKILQKLSPLVQSVESLRSSCGTLTERCVSFYRDSVLPPLRNTLPLLERVMLSKLRFLPFSSARRAEGDDDVKGESSSSSMSSIVLDELKQVLWMGWESAQSCLPEWAKSYLSKVRTATVCPSRLPSSSTNRS